MSGALKKLADVSEAAQLAFWSVVADEYPDATSGDFGPDETFTFNAACDEALTRWVDYNVPVKPNTTLAEFRAGRVWSNDFGRDFPGYQHSDTHEGESGFAYAGGPVVITRTDRGPDVFHVELFGCDFLGPLHECEAKLYEAAFAEGFFK